MSTDATPAADVTVEALDVAAYRIPTDGPESDGTLEWASTTLVTVHVRGGGKEGLGYTYSDAAAAALVAGRLKDLVVGQPIADVPGTWSRMVRAIRNLGRPGLASMAIAAVDTALWDLQARVLGVPLVRLLGSARAAIDAYGSGGFTSYTTERLQHQLGGWAAEGFAKVKMKVGRDARADVERVREARQAIGPSCELFVDANGAYPRKQALAQAEAFRESAVTWFEEPVSSEDLEGLRLLRDRGPAGMAIAAGEYGFDLAYFRRMLDAGAVDVLQADATRCAGITEFMRVGALCQAWGLPLSAHTAPSLHLHPCCALLAACHVEYFHDHARIEHMLLDGAARPTRGQLRPDLTRPGLGLELKRADAARYAL